MVIKVLPAPELNTPPIPDNLKALDANTPPIPDDLQSLIDGQIDVVDTLTGEKQPLVRAFACRNSSPVNDGRKPDRNLNISVSLFLNFFQSFPI